MFAQYKNRYVVLALVLMCWAAITEAADNPDAPRKITQPNIVVILSDDMGFSDIGCYGSEIQTPNLDKLASAGVRFTQFYNTARCCPTRACLLTGLYPHQAGVGHMMEDKGHDGYRGELNRRCVTIAEALRPAGYATYAVGKWHVTKGVKPDGPKHNWPLARGFDRFYGTITGAGSFFDPATLVRDDTMISPLADPDYQPETYYYTDAISDHAVQFVADHHRTQATKPLFLYVAYTAAHWPMHALPKDIGKYRGKYDSGYEAIRRGRFERLKQMGLIAANTPLPPPAADWSKVENKPWESACMEVFAAMIDNMDQGIGRIVAELQRTGRRENTLILFLQDNGGCAETIGRQANKEYPTRPDAPPLPTQAADTLLGAAIPTQTRDGWPVLTGRGALPGPRDTYIAYGLGWANVSNTPWREYKHWVHEGGISTPLVAHWPARIKRSAVTSQPGHLIDVMATCLDVAGADYPEMFRDEPITPLEGKSLLPIFNGGEREGHEAIYWEHEGNRAVRQGKWKLVSKHPGDWELYDIDADRTELHDLSDRHADRMLTMAALYDRWSARSSVATPEELKKLAEARKGKP